MVAPSMQEEQERAQQLQRAMEAASALSPSERCACASGHLCICASVHLCICASGHLGIWASGHLGIWASRHLCTFHPPTVCPVPWSAAMTMWRMEAEMLLQSARRARMSTSARSVGTSCSQPLGVSPNSSATPSNARSVGRRSPVSSTTARFRRWAAGRQTHQPGSSANWQEP